MIERFEARTALRYMLSPKREGFISVVSFFSVTGITLSVAALVLVMSVMNGFRQELLHQILGVNGHVTLSSGFEPIKDFDAVEKTLRQNRGVVSTTASIDRQAILSIGNSIRAVTVRGVRPNALRERPILKNAVSAEDMQAFSLSKGILIGAGIARLYGLGVGDQVTLMVAGGTGDISSTGPKIVRYRVAGTFNLGMYTYDNGMVFMPLKQAQSLFAIKGVTQVEIMVKNPDLAQDFVNKTESEYPTLYMDAWQRVNMSFFNALEVERNTMFIILSAMVLIAGFTIATGQIMMVKDKVRSIAIMRTLGVKRISLIKIFFMIGCILGSIGISLGVGLGLVLVHNLETVRTVVKTYLAIDIFNPEVYSLNTIPFVVDGKQIAYIVGLSFVITCLSAIYPAIRAGYLDPVEGLYHD